MKKNHALAGIMVLAAVLLVLPVGAKAEVYVEAYLGGVQGANAGMDVTNSILFPPNEFTHHIKGKLDPAVMGGLKLGTWFVKEGFLGMNYPDWMKYLGFYLDFSYHRLNFDRQHGSTISNIGYPGIWTNEFWSEGNAATLAFMFAARYGFLPDSEVPFGRLQPYVAVGPAILFTSQIPSLNVILDGFSIETIKPSSQSTAVICLAAEAGVRWMALKNVSIDVSFKYRYAAPSFRYAYFDDFAGARRSFTLDPTLHLLSGQVGAAYHF